MKGALSHAIVVGLVLWALACDVFRLAWRYAQAHPVQAACWGFGLVIVAIVVVTVYSLKIED